jgi:hypothetical protein
MTDSYDPYRHPLSDHFPLLFPQHKGRWNELIAHCRECKAPVPGENVKGYVIPHFHETGYRESARPQLPRMYEVDAIAECTCGKRTRIRYHLNDDMSIEGRSPLTGEWCRWGGPDARSKEVWWKRAFVRVVEWLLPEKPSGER